MTELKELEEMTELTAMATARRCMVRAGAEIARKQGKGRIMSGVVPSAASTRGTETCG